MQIQDLPPPPDGHIWRTGPNSAALYCGRKCLGQIAVKNDSTHYSTTGGVPCSVNAVDVRFAALDLLYSCGLVTLGQVDDAIQGKVAA